MNIGLTFLGILLFVTSLFMMLLILVQRGKGGGLTGALGGMGGQSAFGAKAGDVFTRITVVTAIIWITLCMITIAAFNPPPRDNDSKQEAGAATSGIGGVDEKGDGEQDGDEESTAGTMSDADEDTEDVDKKALEMLDDQESGNVENENSDDTGASSDDNEAAGDDEAAGDESDGPELTDQSTDDAKSDGDKKSDDQDQ